MTTLCISSGHGKKIAGACGIIREHEEAVRVVDALARELAARGVKAYTFEDTISTSQNENLDRIVDWHNSKTRTADISVHFNAFEQCSTPKGCEVWYRTQKEWSKKLSAAIAKVGFKDRGAKCDQPDHSLYFLSNTAMPAVLLEICFVDSQADCDIYAEQFDNICKNLADCIAGSEIVPVPPEPPDEILFSVTGKCSYFGGPDDTGVSNDEGLAFIYDVMDAPQLFLPYQPEDTTGLARRLNPFVHYVACRWNYDKVSKAALLQSTVMVKALKTGVVLEAFCADWGPNSNTGRVADLSPSLMADLGIETDDEVEIVFPA